MQNHLALKWSYIQLNSVPQYRLDQLRNHHYSRPSHTDLEGISGCRGSRFSRRPVAEQFTIFAIGRSASLTPLTPVGQQLQLS